MQITRQVKNYFNKYGQQWLEFLPKLIIYLLCATLFKLKVQTLLQDYLKFDTTSTIEYVMSNDIELPAFTVCGCCIGTPTRQQGNESYIERENHLIDNHSVYEVVKDLSVTPGQLVLECHFVVDSRKPNKSIPCEKFENVVGSINQG